ncbi:MAG: AAA family ATPase [Herpetosiphonaceae bacterium]|nr:AAA family ATPase [Herpetosiphonaceae bacterium]
MRSPLLLIISGPPGSGKTTLGRRLASELWLPFVYKDGIKERLFDTLGWRDRAWSQQLGIATYELLYYFLEVQLAAGCSQIIESNFAAEFATQRFLLLKEQYSFRPCQLMCRTQGEVLLARFKLRAEDGSRHPGHVDQLTYGELEAGLLKGRLEPLAIPGEVIEVDTTDFDSIDYGGLMQQIRALL